ncbi:ABC transporter substrate-binding protein [Scopulibacillus cellulosilyticus]|uniref:ABC transporter substrate-binding protein n=1 Tax=Scopulibacillus cellulosilyticus TaxID=2665665 RepID=A0ABW2PRI1_9BACL
MKKRLLALFLTLMVIFGLLAGCGTSNNDQKANKNSQSKTEQTAFPVTIKDGLGDKVTIKHKPKRIVSLIPSNTEIAFDLGLNKQIVGVSDFDNYPKAALKKTKIGGENMNVEKIISLKPDLVLAHASSAHNSRDGLKQLREAGIPVLVVNDAESFNQVYQSIQMIGQATGTNKKADQIINDMKSKVAAIQEKAKQVPKDKEKRVYIEVSGSPDIYTAGQGTFMNEMLNIIHAKNVAANQKGWVKISEESIVKDNPDVILTTYGYYQKNAVKNLLKRPGWGNVAAVKNKQVYDVNSDLVNRPGPRLVDGLEEMAQMVYPDVFKNKK